jgi:hypothetical protein
MQEVMNRRDFIRGLVISGLMTGATLPVGLKAFVETQKGQENTIFPTGEYEAKILAVDFGTGPAGSYAVVMLFEFSDGTKRKFVRRIPL